MFFEVNVKDNNKIPRYGNTIQRRDKGPVMKNKKESNHLIWDKVMHIFSEKQTKKAGSVLHQKSLININMFINKIDKDLKTTH